MADLKTNYKDDVLNTSVNEKRRFNMIQNEDGTVSFEDVTEYSQVGDSFGAADINATNAAVNKANSNLNVRYNQQTDKLQLLIDGVWVDWKTAGINEYNVLAKNQNINIGNSDTMWSVVSGNKGNPVNYTLNTKTVGQSGAILIGSTSANAQICLQSPVIDCSSYDKAIISASMVSTGNGFIYYYANGGAMQFIKIASATGESLSVTDYELDITNFDTIQIGVGSGTTVMNFNYSITKFILTN